MIDLYSWPAGQERVVDINALRALAPPSLRPRSQAVRPPAPHAAAPLEPQPQLLYVHSTDTLISCSCTSLRLFDRTPASVLTPQRQRPSRPPAHCGVQSTNIDPSLTSQSSAEAARPIRRLPSGISVAAASSFANHLPQSGAKSRASTFLVGER